MKNKTIRYVLALVLALIFIIIVPIGVFIISSVPTITVPSFGTASTSYWANTEPNVNLTLGCLLTTEGSLSVNNPVTVYAIIEDVTLNGTSVPNLLQYYGWISFTSAYFPSSVGNPKQAPISVYLPITATSTPNVYQVKGTVIWLTDGSTWVYLLPAVSANSLSHFIVNAPDVETGSPAATIASSTDTLSIQLNVREEQLSWVLVGVGVLAFQPIIATFIPKDIPPNLPTGQPQSEDQDCSQRHSKKNKSQ